jgi:PKHD-type hydroxylase
MYSFNRSSLFEDVNYDNYYWFENGFTADELSDIEELTKTIEFQTANVGQHNAVTSDHRKSKIKWCPQTDSFKWVYDKLQNMIFEANEMMWKMNITHMREEIQYTEYYDNNSGGYEWHMDCGKGIQNQRKISVTVQLSDPDEYEGGDLEFNIGKEITAPRGKGNVVIFPSFFLHRVTPVTKGTRKSFVLWVGGEPYR